MWLKLLSQRLADDTHMLRRALGLFIRISLCLAAPACSTPSEPSGYVISGRVVDPQQLQPAATRLSIRLDGDVPLTAGRPLRWNGPGIVVNINTDGSFVTPRLAAGMYALQVLRSPASRTEPGRFHADRFVAFRTVTVSTHDINGLTVTIQPDFAVPGRFRMETDNPGARWPDYIGISAYLALEGQPPLAGMAADGTEGGRFWLHNAFGPRVIRTNYRVSGVLWAPTRVLLDGIDITNVPTDFSAGEKRELEVVFTQHPSRLAFSVVGRDGQPMRHTWVVMAAADRALWEQWATTTQSRHLGESTSVEFVTVPGRYLARAFPSSPSVLDAIEAERAALQQLDRLMAGATPIDLGDRETKTVRLVVQ